MRFYKFKHLHLSKVIAGLEYLPFRKLETAFTGGAEKAFAELSKYRDGAIYLEKT